MQDINVQEHLWILWRKKGREASAIKERNDGRSFADQNERGRYDKSRMKRRTKNNKVEERAAHAVAVEPSKLL